MYPTDIVSCRTCGRPVQGSFCGVCGTPVDPPPPPQPDRGVPRPLLLAGAAVGVVLLVVGGLVLYDGGSEPAASSPSAAPAPAPAAPAVPAATAAQTTGSCQRAGSVDGAGRATSYEPQRAVDGDPTTAWRCDGDGVGQSLTVAFGAPERIERVALIPGLAKTDPANGTDRYAQNRRITAVRITTDTGHAVDARLDPSAGNRAPQSVALPAPVVTRTLTLSILGSVPGSVQNGQAAVDSVAIAELTWR
jgi:hypothetical protein